MGWPYTNDLTDWVQATLLLSGAEGTVVAGSVPRTIAPQKRVELERFEDNAPTPIHMELHGTC